VTSRSQVLSKDEAARPRRPMRYIVRITASALLPLVLGSHVQTAENEPKVTTLSCDGALTRKSDANKPINMQELQKTRVVVNLDDYTVFFLGYVVPISDVDQVSIDFGGTQIVDYGFSISIRGHIDRASGRIDVTTVTLDPTKSNDPIVATLRYDMACKATNGGG
jgi:hypothetical protein